MTNRRSLQTNMQRISRAQQFVPGHVGGRVASAQPVRERTKVGVVAKALGADPTTVGTFDAGNVTTGPFDLSIDPLDGLSLQVGDQVVVTFAASVSDYTIPSGWTVLGQGTVGSLEWLAAVHTWTGTSPGDFGVPLVPWGGGSLAAWNWVAGVYRGAVGGTWHLSTGTPVVGVGSGAVVAPDAGWAVREQRVALSGVYYWNSYPSGMDVALGGAIVTQLLYPASALGDSVGEFDTYRRQGTPYATGTYDYASGGAYGVPNSIAMAIGWTP